MVVTDSTPDIGVSTTTPQHFVHVVDDDLSLSKSLRFLLESDGLDVRLYPSSEQFLDAFDATEPGCVLLDLKIEQDDSGLQVLRELANRRSHVPVIMISAHGRVHSAVKALHLGAIDFLEKPFEDRVILARVKAAVEQSVKSWPLHREVERILARRETLTNRQLEVLHLVVAGLSSRQIAERLDVTEKTIEAHRQTISTKMQAGNVSQLVRMIMTADPPGETAIDPDE